MIGSGDSCSQALFNCVPSPIIRDGERIRSANQRHRHHTGTRRRRGLVKNMAEPQAAAAEPNAPVDNAAFHEVTPARQTKQLPSFTLPETAQQITPRRDTCGSSIVQRLAQGRRQLRTRIRLRFNAELSRRLSAAAATVNDIKCCCQYGCSTSDAAMAVAANSDQPVARHRPTTLSHGQLVHRTSLKTSLIGTIG